MGGPCAFAGRDASLPRRKRGMLWGFNVPEILLPTQCERPTFLPRAPSPSLRAASPIREADPRSARRRRRGRRLEPEAEVTSGDRRQPAGRDQPDEAPARVDRVDRAAGGDPGPRAAHRDRVGRRRLFQSPGIVRIRRRASPSRYRRRGLVRLAATCFASPRRISGRSTRLAFSRDTPCAARRSGIWRSGLSATQRSGAGAHAGDELRGRWDPARRGRGAGREPSLGRPRAGSDRLRISPSRII